MTKMHQYLILKTSTNLKLPLCMKVCPTTLNIGRYLKKIFRNHNLLEVSFNLGTELGFHL